MKKNIFLFFVLCFIISCNTTKKTQNKSVGLKGFYSYYNTLFNSKEALHTELNNRKKGYQDNFYTPYIPILTAEQEPLGADFDTDSDTDFEAESNVSFSPLPNRENSTPQAGNPLQIAEAKALKVINKYSVVKNGEERNKQIFDAHILLAQSRILMNKPLEAMDALSYLFTHMGKNKRIALAKIYQAQAYTKMKDYHRAEEIFEEVKNDTKLRKSHAKLLSIYYAEMLLKVDKKEQAVEMLEQAFSLNKNRTLRSRIAFLRGQILSNIGKWDEARESFTTAYKYANDFEFEVKSQIEIAKTFTQNDNYEEAKNHIENMGKKGIYISRKNEFYYALGLMASKAGKHEEANEYYKKALKEKISDGQIRGLTFYEIGKTHFAKDDYISASAYYDSALAVMTYEPEKQRLQELTKNIKNITKNYYLIKKNDSILALTQMTEPEREAYFGKIIQKLKEKEAKEEQELRRAERSKGFENADYNANSLFRNNNVGFQDFSNNKGGFYFANANTISKGSSEFKQLWGNRALADNWRYSAKMNTIEDVKNKTMGIQSAKDPRRFEVEFYTEKIPTEKEELLQLKKDRDTASLGLGMMYENYFSKTELATKTLYDLVDNNPEEDVKLQALYHIFSINYEKNPTAGERAKALILQEFPNTSYAEFVKNPKRTNFSASSPEVEKIYQDAFALYNEEKYNESLQLIEKALEQYPKDALVPKFSLLRAFNTGKTAGKEIMVLQLEQMLLNYPKTLEGKKAEEMLTFLKAEPQSKTTEETKTKNKAVEKKQENEKEEEEIEPETFTPRVPHRAKTPEKDNKPQNNNQEIPDRPNTRSVDGDASQEED